MLKVFEINGDAETEIEIDISPANIYSIYTQYRRNGLLYGIVSANQQWSVIKMYHGDRTVLIYNPNILEKGQILISARDMRNIEEDYPRLTKFFKKE